MSTIYLAVACAALIVGLVLGLAGALMERRGRRIAFESSPVIGSASARLGTEIQTEELSRLQQQGDPAVDRLLLDLLKGNSGLAIDTLEGMVKSEMLGDPNSWPDELREWWEHPALPDWMDWALIARGADLLEEWLPEVVTGYLVGSLPRTFADTKRMNVLSRLGLPGSIVGRVPDGLRLLPVVVTPATLEPGANGYELVRKMRLIRGLERVALQSLGIDVRQPDRVGEPWDIHLNGAPLNQEDMLSMLWSFAVGPLEALERMGIPIPEADRDAVVHLWCVVGHLLGIGSGDSEPALPVSFAEAAKWGRATQLRHLGPSVEGRAATSALLARYRRSMRFGLRGLPGAAMYDALGPQVAGYLGVPRPGLLRYVASASRLSYRIALVVPGGRALQAPARWATRRFVARLADEWLEGEQDVYGEHVLSELSPEQRRRLRPLYSRRSPRRSPYVESRNG